MIKIKDLELAALTSEDCFRYWLEKYIKEKQPKTKLNFKEWPVKPLESIPLRPEQQDALTNTTIFNSEEVKKFSKYTMAVYLEDDLLFIGGILPMWKGVAESWLLVSENFPKLFLKEPKSILRAFRIYIDSVPFKRIQTSVLKSFIQGKKFVELFGFENEGLMKQYGPDQKDYYRYALVKKN